MTVIYNNERNERYEDWCFDCEHCGNNVCKHDSVCKNGEMWEPNDSEYDLN
jgi:hypothetical protein